MHQAVNVVIVGAGINGLCTAWQLAQEFDGADILVIDRFPSGHSRGSSHGEERITRSSYESAHWVAAMLRAQAELWPALEEAVGVPLVHPGPAVFWGPESGPLPAYAEAVRVAGARVEELDVADARARFPHMAFPDAERVLVDHHAGVIAAAQAMRNLEAWLDGHGVRRVVGDVVALEEDAGGVTVRTDTGTLRCAAVIVCAGPFVARLVPSFASRVRPARQSVGFWEMDAEVGRTPEWVHLGADGLHYGLPTLRGGVMKAACHAKPLGVDDPEVEVAPDLAALTQVEARLAEWFTPRPGRRIQADTCFYTNAPDDAFLLEEPPGHTRVLVVSACSGHAFKLAPLTGEAAARWAVKTVG